MTRVLVTGGAGFIGSHVADSLLSRGHSVTILDDLSGGCRENVPDGAVFVHGSVMDHQLVDDLFASSRFEYVFHLAAYAAEGLSHFIRRFNYINNVIGSANLVNASVNTGAKGFVFTSSIAVYGTSPELPMTEATPPRPEDPYGIAKLAVEQDLEAAYRLFGLEYVVFRPHNVFGPRQNIADRYRNVVGIFMNQILQGRPMTIFGDGTQTRAFSYIADVAPVIAATIENTRAWNQTFNIGADQPCSVERLAREVARAMGVEPVIEHLPPRIETVHAFSSHEKIQGAFGELPHTPLEEGLREMAVWVKQHGARSTAPFEAIEVTRNLPAVWREG